MNTKTKDKSNNSPQHKPEWKTILDYIIFQDKYLTFRMCRKMIIHLERMKVPEIDFFMLELNPTFEDSNEVISNGQNWPKPKGNPFLARDVIYRVFDIADKYIPHSELTYLITQWLNREKLRNLSKVLERHNSPLSEIIDALKRYFELGGSKEFTSLEERVGVRVFLISRFLSENLRYINIAKNYITLMAVENIFDRIIGPADGAGKVGGKSAGLILAQEILKSKKKTNPILKDVTTPRSWFLSSDGLFDYMNYNALDDFAFSKYQDPEEVKIEYPFMEFVFKNSVFPPDALQALNKILEDINDRPIVVRSSSILEDSFEASFTGKYKSLFVSNVGTVKERLSELTNAIVEVYSSTFNPDAIEYRKQKGLVDFREEMGILIQEVVGKKVGKYFMPSFAGVAMSHNEFRWSPRIEREDGVVRLVAGLGTMAVDRTINDYPLLVSPKKPDFRLNQSLDKAVRYSQKFVDVIDLEEKKFKTIKFNDLIKETNGIFPGIEDIVSFLRGSTLIKPISEFADFTQDELVINFAKLTEDKDFLNKINEILSELSKAYNSPVDVEFASVDNMLYMLQCRPQSQGEHIENVVIPSDTDKKNKIFSANQYVNNAIIDDIQFVVYVNAKGYSSLQSESEMKEIGEIVSKLNRMLPKRKFILIGPGRWGSKGDIKLGVPINYSDINNTSILIEVARKTADYVPELSFGTHFFQDLVEANIQYLPLYPDDDGIIFNKKFFEDTPNSLPNFIDNIDRYLGVIKLIDINYFKPNGKMTIYMNGETSEALSIVSSIQKKER